jgi:hypothetical protein
VPGLIDELVQVLDQRLEDESVASVCNALYAYSLEVVHDTYGLGACSVSF